MSWGLGTSLGSKLPRGGGVGLHPPGEGSDPSHPHPLTLPSAPRWTKPGPSTLPIVLVFRPFLGEAMSFIFPFSFHTPPSPVCSRKGGKLRLGSFRRRRPGEGVPLSTVWGLERDLQGRASPLTR